MMLTLFRNLLDYVLFFCPVDEILTSFNDNVA